MTRPHPLIPHPSRSRTALTLAISLALLQAAPFAAAQTSQSREFEQLEATTMALIDVLVDNGVLTRDKADALIAAARQKAEAQIRARALAEAQVELGQQPAAPRQPEPRGAAVAQETGRDGKRVIRVPYVPESLKNEMREQIKQEVLAQSRNERWGEPGALPSWLEGLRVEGDVRVREERVALSRSNTPPGPGGVNYYNGELTRAADIATSTANGVNNFNTQQDFDRLRLRARLGATATIGERATAGIRLATGNPAPSSTRTSNNQTLGQGFNNYSAVVDHGYLAVRPLPDLKLTAGRFANPFFATDLVWNEDLAFEGVAGSYTADLRTASVFVNGGYFPLSENRPGTSRSRSLAGLQAGLESNLMRSPNRLRLGVALYDYNGLGAARETPAAQTLEPTYATRYEYAAGLRQRGNTLFNVRAPGDNGAPVFGLASDFRELNVTGTLDLPELLRVPAQVTVDYVKNLAYSPQDIRARTGFTVTDGHDWGALLRLQLGKPKIERRGDWNASVTWRTLGSDAVLDAFAHTDFGLGGTNDKGYILSFNYGLYDRTTLGVRWMSSNPIDSYLPGASTPTRLSVDTLQLDLTTRF